MKSLDERMAEINAAHGWPSSTPDPELRAIIDRDLAKAEEKRSKRRERKARRARLVPLGQG